MSRRVYPALVLVVAASVAFLFDISHGVGEQLAITRRAEERSLQIIFGQARQTESRERTLKNGVCARLAEAAPQVCAPFIEEAQQFRLRQLPPIYDPDGKD